VTDVKEHTIELRGLISARNSSQAFDLRCYIRENLIKFLSKNYPDSLPKNRYVFDQFPPDELSELPGSKKDF
jgi:hypothetical protein